MTEPKQFGLTRGEWQALYDDADWKHEVSATCRDVAACDHAAPSDRELAVQILGSLVEFGFAPALAANGRSFPQFVRDVQISIVRGRPEQLDEAKRDLMHERLGGVVWTLSTVQKFVDAPLQKVQPQAELTGAN